MCKLNSGSLTSIRQALLVHILGSKKKKPGSFLDTTTISLHFFFFQRKRVLKRLEFCFAREFISFPFARTAATRIRSKGVGLVMGAVLKFAVAQTELYLRFLVILLQTLAN